MNSPARSTRSLSDAALSHRRSGTFKLSPKPVQIPPPVPSIPPYLMRTGFNSSSPARIEGSNDSTNLNLLVSSQSNSNLSSTVGVLNPRTHRRRMSSASAASSEITHPNSDVHGIIGRARRSSSFISATGSYPPPGMTLPPQNQLQHHSIVPDAFTFSPTQSQIKEKGNEKKNLKSKIKGWEVEKSFEKIKFDGWEGELDALTVRPHRTFFLFSDSQPFPVYLLLPFLNQVVYLIYLKWKLLVHRPRSNLFNHHLRHLVVVQIQTVVHLQNLLLVLKSLNLKLIFHLKTNPLHLQLPILVSELSWLELYFCLKLRNRFQSYEPPPLYHLLLPLLDMFLEGDKILGRKLELEFSVSFFKSSNLLPSNSRL